GELGILLSLQYLFRLLHPLHLLGRESRETFFELLDGLDGLDILPRLNHYGDLGPLHVAYPYHLLATGTCCHPRDLQLVCSCAPLPGAYRHGNELISVWYLEPAGYC